LLFKLLRSKFLWLILLILLSAVGLMIFGASGYTEGKNFGPLQVVYAPLHRAAAGITNGFNNFASIFSNKKALQAQVAQMQQQLDALQMENQSLKEYKSEAERLQKLLAFRDTNISTMQLQAAHVIARSPNNWYKNVSIDRGSQDGMAKGMPVICPEGLVGRVTYVTAHSAQVTLITDREIAVGAILEKDRETNGIVEGFGNNTELRMQNIPFYSQIQVYDVIVTSDLSQTYPKGIPIGTVTEVVKEPGGLLLKASLKPAVDFDRLEEVLVIMSYHPQQIPQQ
jgi:rod shape-determining protein MreC